MAKHTDAVSPPQDDSTPLLGLIPKGAVMHADRLAPSWPAVTVLHSDGHWHPATLLAWCRHRGGWAAFIHWPDGTQDWRKHDPACLRPPAAHPGKPSPGTRHLGIDNGVPASNSKHDHASLPGNVPWITSYAPRWQDGTAFGRSGPRGSLAYGSRALAAWLCVAGRAGGGSSPPRARNSRWHAVHCRK
jgi:hypothetical protein